MSIYCLKYLRVLHKKVTTHMAGTGPTGPRTPVEAVMTLPFGGPVV